MGSPERPTTPLTSERAGYVGTLVVFLAITLLLLVFIASGLSWSPGWLAIVNPRGTARVGWILALIPGIVAVVNFWVAEYPRAARAGTGVERWLRKLQEKHASDPRAEPALIRISAHLDNNLVTSDRPRFGYTLFGAFLLTLVFGLVAQLSDGPYGIGVRETSSLGGRGADPGAPPPPSPRAGTATPRPSPMQSPPPVTPTPGATVSPATLGGPVISPSPAPPPTSLRARSSDGPPIDPSGTDARDVGNEAATGYSPVPEQKGPIFGETIRGVVFSGLGAYIFALQLLIGRINTGSLTGRFLIRLAAQSAIALVLGAAAAQVGVGFAIGTERQTLFLYFALGLFPGLVRQALSRRGRAFFAADEAACENLPLCLIDGIDDDTVDRLAEMGITDCQHLATVDPIDFMLKAGYPPMRVLDWIDQAMLVTYIRRRIAAVRVYGIRGAIDFAVLYLDYKADLQEPPAGDAAAARARIVVSAMAIRTEMPQEVLLQIGRAVWEDDNLHFVWLLWMNRVFWVNPGDDDGDGPPPPPDGTTPPPDGPPSPPGGSAPAVGLSLSVEPPPKTPGG